MALFSKTKTTKTAKVAKTKKADATPAVVAPASGASYAHVLMNPRITEKATMQSGNNVITFDVSVRTNKREIAKAVQSLYKVTPVAVRVVTVRAKMKKNARTGRMGMSTGGKKAYVQLKQGDSINLV
jgi:ribosomal protein L23